MGRCPSAKQPYVPRPSDCGQPFTQESGGEPVPQLPSASSWVLTACGPGETLTLNGRLQAKHLCTADRQQTELFLAGRSVGTLTRYPEHGALALRHSLPWVPQVLCVLRSAHANWGPSRALTRTCPYSCSSESGCATWASLEPGGTSLVCQQQGIEVRCQQAGGKVSACREGVGHPSTSAASVSIWEPLGTYSVIHTFVMPLDWQWDAEDSFRQCSYLSLFCLCLQIIAWISRHIPIREPRAWPDLTDLWVLTDTEMMPFDWAVRCKMHLLSLCLSHCASFYHP